MVLLAPMASVGECWAPVADALAASHRVVTFDYPGMGGSPPLADEALTLPGLADLTAGLMDALDLGEAHLIAMSFGGAVGQHVALRHPTRLRSLTLIATAARYGASATTARGGVLFLRHQLALRMGWEGRRRQLFTRLLFSSAFLSGADAERRDALAAMWGPSPDREAMGAQLSALGPHDTTARLGDFPDIPTLLIRSGSADLLLKASQQENLAIPHATVRAFPDAGHAVTVEEHDEVLAALQQHLAAAD